MLWEQLKIEYKVYLRQPLYLIFSMLMPILSFYMFGMMYRDMSYGGVDFFSQYIPGYCVLILFASSVYNVGNQVVGDKEKGIYKRMAVTPVSLGRVMFTVILKAASVAIVAYIIMMLIAKFSFGVKFPNLLTFTFVYILAIFYSLVLGFGLGAIMKKQNTYSAVMMVLFMPMFILSDATLPLKILPQKVQNIAEYNPLYRLNVLLRSIWNPKLANELASSVRFSLVYLIVLIVIYLFIVAYFWNNKERR